MLPSPQFAAGCFRVRRSFITYGIDIDTFTLAEYTFGHDFYNKNIMHFLQIIDLLKCLKHEYSHTYRCISIN